MEHPPSIGTQFVVTVKKVIATGLLVSLPDGQPGIIRQRELSWHQPQTESWQQGFAPGQKRTALVVGHLSQAQTECPNAASDSTLNASVELSLRLVERDPWQSVAARLRPSMLVTGTITGVTGYGAFVALEPGVTGLLHQSQLPAWLEQEMSDLFWVGDRVRAMVAEIDDVTRKIRLSMKGLADHRWRSASAHNPASHCSASAMPAVQKEEEARTLPVMRDREQSLIISNPTADQPGAAERPAGKPAGADTEAHTALRNCLQNLRRQTGASTAILFRLDPQQRHVGIVAHRGKEAPRSAALGDLIHSPVRDVAEDGLVVQVGSAARAATYVRYLTPLLCFHSCVGVPVPVHLAQRYALFLFSRTENFVGNAIVRNATATATVIGALLDQGAFLERASDMQSAILLGHLSRALIHETNHGMNPILFALRNLERQCQEVAAATHHTPERIVPQMQSAQHALHQLSDYVQKLAQTTQLFSSLTVQSAPAMVRLDTVIERCMALLQDTAERERVSLHFQPPHRLVTTFLNESHVQQVLLNVLLNAIQQIARCRPEKGGAVHVSVDVVAPGSGGSGRMIRILVEDDGPGIHQRLWKRIFELGYTTRIGEGSGLGLYLSQRLLHELGGRMYVQESCVGWGTCMAIDLPLQVT